MEPGLLFAAIADDYTGGSDLAGMLAGHGVRTAQLFGVPEPALVEAVAGQYDAVVVCLKTRSIPAAEAQRLSLEALARVQPLRPRQVQFKYCSTFDSTPAGNIGPVTDALMEALGTEFTVAVPALPVNGRTQYLGYLFVNGVLLSESPMRNHPLNPMTEPNLVRHLQAQTRRRCGLIPWPAVRHGAESIRSEVLGLRRLGVQIALVDALSGEDLSSIAEAVADEVLITGGSGITQKLPDVWRALGWWKPDVSSRPTSVAGGKEVLILSGSCSAATLQQVSVFTEAGAPALRMNIEALCAGRRREVDRLLEAAMAALERDGKVLIYSSAPAEERETVLARLERAGLSAEQVRLTIEQAMAELARLAVSEAAVRNIVVAGGETAGALLEALAVHAVQVLDSLDPGVPALRSIGDAPLGLVLKSGNFGSPDFFAKAARYLEGI